MVVFAKTAASMNCVKKQIYAVVGVPNRQCAVAAPPIKLKDGNSQKTLQS